MNFDDADASTLTAARLCPDDDLNILPQRWIAGRQGLPGAYGGTFAGYPVVQEARGS